MFEEDTYPGLAVYAGDDEEDEEGDEGYGNEDYCGEAEEDCQVDSDGARCDGRNNSTGSEKFEEDPVKVYLGEIGKSPLLSKDEEQRIAMKIDGARNRFRRTLLGSDYVMGRAVSILKKVSEGGLAFDRNVQVGRKDRREKEEVKKRMPQNLKTIEGLLEKNSDDYRIALTGSRGGRMEKKRREAWERLGRRKKRSVNLAEELGLRTSKLKPFLEELEEHSRRVQELKGEIMVSGKVPLSDDDLAAKRAEYRKILIMHKESPRSLAERAQAAKEAFAEYTEAKQELVKGNLRLVPSIAKHYLGRGVDNMDLIEEGNTGLMTAADKFDHRQGYKFCTYATYWIKQAIMRAVSKQSRPVSIPSHLSGAKREKAIVSERLTYELERKPNQEEIINECHSPDKYVALVLDAERPFLRLDCLVGSDEDSAVLYADKKAEDPADLAGVRISMKEISEAIDTCLDKREKEILLLRYLEEGFDYTLEEIGQRYEITRERVRQILLGAIRKLKRYLCGRNDDGEESCGGHLESGRRRHGNGRADQNELLLNLMTPFEGRPPEGYFENVILACLAHSKRHLSIAEVVRACGSTADTVSKHMKCLEDRGFVTVGRKEGGRRKYVCRLTDLGKEEAKRLHELHCGKPPAKYKALHECEHERECVEIIEYLAEKPIDAFRHVEGIALALEKTIFMASTELKKLWEHGFVSFTVGALGKKHYVLTDKGWKLYWLASAAETAGACPRDG